MIFQVQNGSFGYHHKNILNQISFEVTDAMFWLYWGLMASAKRHY